LLAKAAQRINQKIVQDYVIIDPVANDVISDLKSWNGDIVRLIETKCGALVSMKVIWREAGLDEGILTVADYPPGGRDHDLDIGLLAQIDDESDRIRRRLSRSDDWPAALR